MTSKDWTKVRVEEKKEIKSRYRSDHVMVWLGWLCWGVALAMWLGWPGFMVWLGATAILIGIGQVRG